MVSEGNEQRNLHKSTAKMKSTEGNDTHEIATVRTVMQNEYQSR